MMTLSKRIMAAVLLTGLLCNSFPEAAYATSVRQPSPSDTHNTYFSPSITVIYGLVKKTIHGSGSCRDLALIRFCARVAPPGKHGNRTNPGGSNEADTRVVVQNPDGTVSYAKIPRPQICAYQDPLDGGDTQIKVSPYHQNTPRESQEARTAETIALGSTLGAAVAGPAAPFFLMAAGIAKLVSLILENYNHVVVDTVGCVEIPLAPSPPPFCPRLPKFKHSLSIQEICIAANGKVQQPSLDTMCTASEPPSTFERPRLRITASDIWPLCKGGSPLARERCVILRNMPTDGSLVDVVENCQSTSTSPCVDSLTLPKTDISARYRVHYTYIYPSDGKEVGTVDTRTNEIPVAEAGGINRDNFVDLSCYFNYKSFATENRELVEANGAKRRIFLEMTTDDPLTVCAYESVSKGRQVVACVERPTAPLPVAKLCDGSESDCPASTNEKPFVKISLGNAPDVQTKVLTAPLSLNGVEDGDPIDTAYLHGIRFRTSVKGDVINPMDEDGNQKGEYDPDGNYLRGLEYENFKYTRGAKKICLEGFESNSLALVKAVPVGDNQDVVQPSQKPADVLVKPYIPGITAISYSGRPTFTPSSPLQDPLLTINPKVEAVRALTPEELNLCFDVPAYIPPPPKTP